MKLADKTGRIPGANGHGPEAPSKVSVQRVRQFKQSRFNPLRNLTPAILSRQLDDFALGYLREFALTMDAIERRDDVLKCVAPKRKAAVARRTWEVCTIDGLTDAQQTEAAAHVEALQYFYNHATATDAVERHQRGGLSLLIRQMMDAMGKKYAVHELIFQPSPEGLTARFNFVPLWFFENLTGELRFLEQNFAYEGRALEPGAWMVTVGEGLMEACAVAWMYKSLPLKDWLALCEKFGMPGLIGKTSAAQGTEEWDNLVAALAAFGQDWAVVTNESASVTPLEFKVGSGNLPQPQLVDRMDRRMSALWRGADLSTMSSGEAEGHGASLQGKEENNLECDDAQLISETLNAQVDPLVIAWTFGEGVKPLAYIKIIVPPLKDTTSELAVDTFLRDSGCPMQVGPVLERYGRPLPEGADADAPLQRSSPAAGALPGFGRPGPEEEDAANERMADLETSFIEFFQNMAADHQPLADRLKAIIAITDPTMFRAKIEELHRDFSPLLADINRDPTSARTLTKILRRQFNRGLEAAGAGSPRPPQLA